jgi:hypothetical protein
MALSYHYLPFPLKKKEIASNVKFDLTCPLCEDMRMFAQNLRYEGKGFHLLLLKRIGFGPLQSTMDLDYS